MSEENNPVIPAIEAPSGDDPNRIQNLMDRMNNFMYDSKFGQYLMSKKKYAKRFGKIIQKEVQRKMLPETMIDEVNINAESIDNAINTGKAVMKQGVVSSAKEEFGERWDDTKESVGEITKGAGVAILSNMIADQVNDSEMIKGSGMKVVLPSKIKGIEDVKTKTEIHYTPGIGTNLEKQNLGFFVSPQVTDAGNSYKVGMDLQFNKISDLYNMVTGTSPDVSHIISDSKDWNIRATYDTSKSGKGGYNIKIGRNIK
jgi:hypothetical protein